MFQESLVSALLVDIVTPSIRISFIFMQWPCVLLWKEHINLLVLGLVLLLLVEGLGIGGRSFVLNISCRLSEWKATYR